MTATIERRIQALEQDIPATGFRTVFCTFVAPEAAECELFGVREFCGPMKWERQPDESERAFLDRVELQAPRNRFGIAVLVQDD